MDEELRAELLRRVEVDQAARKGTGAEAARAAVAADRENLPWLKELVSVHGWPGTPLVGADGAHAAWLLVQHADQDPAFQRRCLTLLQAAVESGEAGRRQLAYLTDRVLLAEGQPQVYGTQLAWRQGVLQPRTLADPDTVDERRAAAGLEPLADYLRSVEQIGRPERWLVCPGCGGWIPYERPDNADAVTVTCGTCGRESTVQATE